MHFIHDLKFKFSNHEGCWFIMSCFPYFVEFTSPQSRVQWGLSWVHHNSGSEGGTEGMDELGDCGTGRWKTLKCLLHSPIGNWHPCWLDIRNKWHFANRLMLNWAFFSSLVAHWSVQYTWRGSTGPEQLPNITRQVVLFYPISILWASLRTIYYMDVYHHRIVFPMWRAFKVTCIQTWCQSLKIYFLY